MQYDIRKPKKEDVKAIDKLFELTIRDNFKEEGIIDSQNVEANKEIDSLKEGLRIYFESKELNHKFLIASSQDEIIGTIAYGKSSALIYENLKIDYTNTPEIKSVYILPKHQNKGIGTLLLRKILIVLKENNIKCFCLDSGYKKAQHYWNKRLGKPICVLNDYWSKGSHHMIWYCQVDDILEFNTN